MKRISFIFESCKEAIRVTFFGFVCIAIGFLIKNENINIFYTFKSTFVLVSAEYLFKFGECIIVNLPIIFMLNLVCKKSHSAFPLISALLGYFAFIISTMLFSPSGLDSNAYMNNSFITSTFEFSSGNRLPLNTGMIGSFIIAFITRYTYIRSRHNTIAYNNSYFDKDLFGIAFNIVFCVIAGMFVSFAYPFLFEQTQRVFQYISSDLKDPVRIGVYGIFDRVFTILGVPNIVKNPFYFSSLGGSYTTSGNGTIIMGDVGIWEATKDLSEGYVGAGRFITPYYVINIFIIPFIYLGIAKSITNRKEKNRFYLLFILISVLSIVCGNPLPTELFLLFSAPFLLIIYLLIVGLVFGVLMQFEVFLGSNISSLSPWVTMPGSLPDYLINLRNVYHLDAVKNIAIVGIIMGVIIGIISIAYFRFFAADPNTLKSKNGYINEIFDAVGGKENIKDCTSGLYRVMIIVYDFEKIDMEKVKQMKASKIFETKNGINIDVGSSAYILAKTIRDSMSNDEYDDEQETIEIEED